MSQAAHQNKPDEEMPKTTPFQNWAEGIGNHDDAPQTLEGGDGNNNAEEPIVIPPSQNSCPITWRRENWCMGVTVFATGLVIALIVFMPNVMMSDSGTQQAVRATNIALSANLFFLLGGIVGMVTNLGWWALLPGALLQVLALVMLGS